MPKWLVVILALVLFFAGAAGVVVVYHRQVLEEEKKTSFTATPITYQLSPPGEALIASASAVRGNVEKQSRGEDNFAPLHSGDSVLQGESVQTVGQTATATLSYPNLTTIALAGNTLLSASDTIPTENLLVQQSGIATYTALSSTPVSVRIGKALVVVSGETTLTYASSKSISLRVVKGTAAVGYETADNITVTKTYSPGRATTIIFR